MCSSLALLAERGAYRIGEALGGTWRWELLHQAADGQSVFAYSSSDQTLIGKFCQDAGGPHSFRALQALAGRAHQWFRVPTPVFYDVDMSFLVTYEAIGTSCNGMPIVSMSDRLLRIGRSLRELHQSDADLGVCKSMLDHVNELIRPNPRVVAESLPQYSTLILESIDKLELLAGKLGSFPAVPLHRDFHLRQLFDDGKFITVVDWDLSAQGDPAFDVAYFTNYLRTHYEATVAEAGVNVFLAGYEPDEKIAERLKVYELFNYLRRACRRFRLQDENWLSVIEAMLSRIG